MRYIVKAVIYGVIVNDLFTNNLSQAIEKEKKLKLDPHIDTAWICDTLDEILVG